MHLAKEVTQERALVVSGTSEITSSNWRFPGIGIMSAPDLQRPQGA